MRLKVFDTLRVLIENAGRLVTKQELLDTVWPETTVEENNLNHNVSVLRKALGEKATGQQFIETVPRVGYRFVAAVETVEPRAGRGGVSDESAAGNQVLPTTTAFVSLCEHWQWTALVKASTGRRIPISSGPARSAAWWSRSRFTTASSATTSAVMACRNAMSPM